MFPNIYFKQKKKFPIIIERSIFLDRLNLNEFISLCNCVDVLLDPFYFGGGNSFLESMVVGTPTVTMPGENLRENIRTHKKIKLDCRCWVAGTYHLRLEGNL